MNYRLTYSKDAEAQLTEFWMVGPNRADITWAQNKIDEILERNPFQGIEVRERLFGLVVPPLKAYYEINESARFVKVTGIAKLI